MQENDIKLTEVFFPEHNYDLYDLKILSLYTAPTYPFTITILLAHIIYLHVTKLLYKILSVQNTLLIVPFSSLSHIPTSLSTLHALATHTLSLYTYSYIFT